MRNRAKLFVHDFKAFLYDAMARPGTGRIELAKNIADALVKKNTAAEATLLQQFVRDRGIKYLLHFTPIYNLRSILRLGFVPRKFLDMPGIKESIRPLFPDLFRQDGQRDCFCLSISWPNYKMFFQKRKQMLTDWVVLRINVETIIKHQCLFYKTNAASSASRRLGPGRIEEMFYDDGIREQLSIEKWYTTDPQAEVMSFSRISPQWINEIYVQKLTKEVNREFTHLGRQNLLKRDNSGNRIKVTEDKTFFGPRKDFQFWKK
mgnify:FL=1